MPSIVETLNIIKDEFSVFSDPRDKYVFLVDLAKDLEGLDDQEKNEINRIHGCTSQAWVTRKINGEKYFFSFQKRFQKCFFLIPEYDLSIKCNPTQPDHYLASGELAHRLMNVQRCYQTSLTLCPK